MQQESIGGEIVEILNVPQKYDRPKTAAPQTNNAEVSWKFWISRVFAGWVEKNVERDLRKKKEKVALFEKTNLSWIGELTRDFVDVLKRSRWNKHSPTQKMSIFMRNELNLLYHEYTC